jgi:hypothetical protein
MSNPLTSGFFSTIASDLVWYEIVYIEAVIVPSAGVFGRQRKVVFGCDFL